MDDETETAIRSSAQYILYNRSGDNRSPDMSCSCLSYAIERASSRKVRQWWNRMAIMLLCTLRDSRRRLAKIGGSESCRHFDGGGRRKGNMVCLRYV
jgi:hypothetical protein